MSSQRRASVKWLLPAAVLLLLCFLIPRYRQHQILKQRQAYHKLVTEHPYANRQHYTKKDLKVIPKAMRPDLAWEQDYLATMDPSTGRPEPERLYPIYRQLAEEEPLIPGTPGAEASWVERGPANVGGRTRAIMFDPNDGTNKKVWAGGVTGGLWYTTDITNDSEPWTAVDDFWANIAITCMAYDPNNTQIFYVGTGEGFGAGSSRGAGIWKSTDGGSTWSQLAASTGYYYVNDIVVRNETGTSVIYAGVSYSYYEGTWHGPAEGLYRSTDGGTSFSQVLPAVPAGSGWPYCASDIEIGADNRLWVGTRRTAYASTQAAGSGGGTVLYSDDGTSWTTSTTFTDGHRVELACAPSDADVVYAVAEDESPADSDQDVAGVFRTDNAGSSWSTITTPVYYEDNSKHFTRAQAGYDLILAVHPTTSSTVIMGGIDLHKSTDSGANWSTISHWYGRDAIPYVHADHHAIVFRPGNNDQAVFGSDGGVSYSADVGSAATPAFTERNYNYNVTQFYSCALNPDAESNFFMGGTQDNGTQQFNYPGLNNTIEVVGGDGGFCHIDETTTDNQTASYVYNNIYTATDGGNVFTQILSSGTGLFINPSDLDYNQDVLYSGYSSTQILRISSIWGTPASATITVPGMANYVTHIRVSEYTTGSSTLFIGNRDGKVYKMINAESGSPSVADITGSGFPSGTVSCVDIGASENELMVTFSNYGVTSVWYSSDGGSNWSSKEGDLPDMPVRWCLFNPLDRTEVVLATEVGIWRTTNFDNASPSWSASTTGMANVRVDMLQRRDSDNMVLAATYGRGMFTGEFENGVVNPHSVIAEGATPHQVDLSWVRNVDSDNVLVAYNTSNTFGTPTDGSSYSAGGSVSGGGTIVYNGSSTSTSHTGLMPGTHYYYKLWSVDGSNNYSPGVTTSDNTVFTTAFTENFDDATFPPPGWLVTFGVNGLGEDEKWERSTSNTYNSSAGCGSVAYDGISGDNTSEDWLVMDKIRLGAGTSTLTFYQRQFYGTDYSSGYSIRVSTTSQNDPYDFTTVTSWDESSFGTTYSQKSVDLSAYAGQDVYIAFVFSQDDGDGWYVDDVQVTTSTVALTGTVFLEGPYDTGSHLMTTSLNSGGYIPVTSPYSDGRTISSVPADIVDWVYVSLRSTATGAAVTGRSALLHKNGSIREDDGSDTSIDLSAGNGSYYVVIEHRNHLAVESAAAVDFSGGSASYNFSTALSQHYGSDAALLETGVYGMYAGDTDSNGAIVFATEVTNIRSDNLLGGYYGSDLNMDGAVVFATEVTIVRANNLYGTNVQ